MRAHIIQNGVVANTIEIASLNHPKWYLLDASLGGQIGDSWDGQTFTTPPPDPEVVRKAAIDEAIGNDATVASLKAMTNAEFSAWFTSNVTTLAQARNVLERLARIVIRRVL